MKTNTILKGLVASTLLFSNISAVAAEELIEPTGLNQIHEIIENDSRINKKISAENIKKAQDSVTAMNLLINEAILARGLANDGDISIADTKEINHYLLENHADRWADLRGQDGYALIERKSSTTIMAKNAVRNVWGNIYNLGFETTNKDRRLTNYKGKKSSGFTSVGYNLGEVLKNDIASGTLNNPNFQEVVGTTGTKLDMIVNVILTDKGLVRKISTGDLRIGAESANKMNALIVEGIKAEGLGNDGNLTAADMRTLNRYLVENHQELWAVLHGDDENDEETGYHKVQNDGAYTRMFADNVINSIADGIYHLGFETDNERRLLNEDGNKNKSFEKVAWWLDTTLKKDLLAGKFSNPEYKEVVGETGTRMDNMINYIYNDEGLLRKVSMDDIRAAAYSANEMNKLIFEGIKETGIANDNAISTNDVKLLNQYLVENYADVWAELHGDDENDEETGYHRIQNDGAIGIMNGKNHINNLADGVYHLGFKTKYKNRLVNEDGNKNVSFKNLAYWLNKALQADLASGVLKK
jgi:hypothetical protein